MGGAVLGISRGLWAELGGSPSGPCVQCFSGDSSAQPIQSGGEGRGEEGRSVTYGSQTPQPPSETP